MTASVNLSCACGATEWTIAPSAKGTHLMCYCKDCQTFAQHLAAADYLDENGGTQIFQTMPRHLSFTKGANNLGVLRLGPKGTFRWYTTCCGTPVGNTLGAPNPSFVGAILPLGTNGFGQIEACLNTSSTKGAVAEFGMAKTIGRFLRRAFWARLTGQAKATPFFDRSGAPVAEPSVLTLEERKASAPD